MYNKIVNPLTGRKVSIYGKIGKEVIKNYLTQIGGAKCKNDSECKIILKKSV